MTEDEITLTVLAGNVGQELELTKAAADRYMEMHSNVTVRVLDTPDFVQDRLGVYLQLFERWKDAEPDLPVLAQARREYEALGQR